MVFEFPWSSFNSSDKVLDADLIWLDVLLIYWGSVQCSALIQVPSAYLNWLDILVNYWTMSTGNWMCNAKVPGADLNRLDVLLIYRAVSMGNGLSNVWF